MASASSMKEGEIALLSNIKIEIDVAEECLDSTETHPYGMLNPQAGYHCLKQEPGETWRKQEEHSSALCDIWLKQEATDRKMPLERAAFRGVAEVIQAAADCPGSRTQPASGQQPAGVSVRPSTSGVQEGGIDLAAVLAELRRLREQQEAYQAHTQSAIAALQQENQRLRQVAPREPGTATQTPGPSATVTQANTTAGSVVSLINSIKGEPAVNSVPVDLFVDVKVKNRIWANEAVDFAILLNRDEHVSYDITVSKSAEGPSLHIQDSPTKASVLNESSWMAAWNIFLAIYMQRYPAAVPGLAVHFQQVHQLMQESGDWRSYDRSFRRMIEKGLQQWGVANPALYTHARLKFVHSALAAPNIRSESPAAVLQEGKRAKTPKGFCFSFHSKGSCKMAKCRFKHLCYNCQIGNHPASQCVGAGNNTRVESSFPGESRRGGRIARH